MRNRRWTVFSIKEPISKLVRKSSDKFRIFPWGYHTTIVLCLAATFNVWACTCVSSWWGCNLPLSRGRTPSSKPTAPAGPGCWPAREPSGTASIVHRRLQLESKIDTPNSWNKKDRLTFRQQDGLIVSGSTYLLREMKAAYSILWVEPGVVTLLGVSSTKIMWGLDRALFSFSWTSFSLKLICWSVFLRCLYQPITLSFQRGDKIKPLISAGNRKSSDSHENQFLPAYCLPGFSSRHPSSRLLHCYGSCKTSKAWTFCEWTVSLAKSNGPN